jgi:hypothetical protein
MRVPRHRPCFVSFYARLKLAGGGSMAVFRRMLTGSAQAVNLETVLCC